MELPQPSRPYAGEGRKATHDFLSLYGHSPVQQDPRPSSHGGYLKTHNFLQPLEKEGKCKVKEDSNTDGINVEKPPLSAPSPVEQVFPKGIEYRINHVSYFNPRMPKTEGTSFNVATAVSNNDRNDENSNVSSYTAGSTPFTLWDESSSRKGKTGKENLDDLNFTKEPVARTGQWPIERPSESSSNHPNNFRSRSSSQPPEHKNQSFVQMLIAGKLPHAKEEDEDDVFTLREDNPQRGELRIKVDGRASNEQKANTPRSKHSATEQRRRCKINDRFQTLRKIIPNSDQKRDKASFLLEVIEYIQFLQEKVSRYEGYPGCSSEPKKSTPWTSSPELAGHFADQPGAVNGQVLMFTPDDMNNINTSNFQRKQQNPAEPATDNPIPLKAMDEVTNSTSLIPLPRLPEDIFPSLQNNVVTQPACPAQDADDVSRMQQLWQSRPHSSEFITDTSNQEKAANGGSISISNKYSQGLLNALTQALMSSGVDVSQASISVQVDIGKQTNPAQNAHKASMDFDINCDSLETRQLEESNCTTKRLKTLKS